MKGNLGPVRKLARRAHSQGVPGKGWLCDEIEIEVHGFQVVIRPVNHPRAGWDESFAEMALRGDDKLLDPIRPSKWDESEWVG